MSTGKKEGKGPVCSWICTGQSNRERTMSSDPRLESPCLLHKMQWNVNQGENCECKQRGRERPCLLYNMQWTVQRGENCKYRQRSGEKPCVLPKMHWTIRRELGVQAQSLVEACSAPGMGFTIHQGEKCEYRHRGRG